MKGKVKPIAIYELLSEEGQLPEDARAVRDCFAAGLVAYRERRWSDAETAFRYALDVRPEDGPSRVFVARCASYADSPPADDWDGVYEMKTK